MNIKDLRVCQQKIVWEPMISRDDYGKPVYGPPKTFRGRRTFKVSRVATKAGGGPKGEGVDVI